MKQRIVLLFSFLMIGLSSCKEDQKIVEDYSTPSVSTFYFIRHAEKDRTDPENRDPELNQAGLGRAMHWAEILNDVSLDAIYTTDFERTSMTAAPTAVKQEVTAQYYDPEILDIEQFKADNLNKNVLVVGHSNTTPALVNKMIGIDKYNNINDHENGNLYIVQIVNGKTTDMQLTFNCNCPTRD